MKAFAALLDRLAYTPSRNDKLRLLADYFAATPDPDRDSVDGPWTLAAAGERSHPDTGARQRAVVVGASGWFFDAFTQRGRVIDGRTVQVGAFPISVDARHFERLAGARATLEKAEQLRQKVSGRRIVLGVDRLDYTKGIDVRLKTIEELLRRGAVTADELVFIQVAVPSREKVADYADMRRRISGVAMPARSITRLGSRNLMAPMSLTASTASGGRRGASQRATATSLSWTFLTLRA